MSRRLIVSESHGVCGEGEEVAEDAHQEADQLRVGGEGQAAVCQTPEEAPPRQRGRKRSGRQVEEDPASPSSPTRQISILHQLVPGRPGEGQASRGGSVEKLSLKAELAEFIWKNLDRYKMNPSELEPTLLAVCSLRLSPHILLWIRRFLACSCFQPLGFYPL